MLPVLPGDGLRTSLISGVPFPGVGFWDASRWYRAQLHENP
jgi:hypothetical protein